MSSTSRGHLPQSNWPTWWEWDLELTEHLLDRLQERSVTELELRRLLHHAWHFRPDLAEGRWRIETRRAGQRWLLVVEPDPERQLLVVITLFPVKPPAS